MRMKRMSLALLLVVLVLATVSCLAGTLPLEKQPAGFSGHRMDGPHRLH